MTKEQALQIANEYLISKKKSQFELRIYVDDILTYEFGWIFFYQSKVYVNTGDLDFMVAGNAPIIVDNETGEVVVTGTRLNLDDYTMLYAKYRPDIAAFKQACLSYLRSK